MTETCQNFVTLIIQRTAKVFLTDIAGLVLVTRMVSWKYVLTGGLD